jgi:hypothetical protein
MKKQFNILGFNLGTMDTQGGFGEIGWGDLKWSRVQTPWVARRQA